MALEFADLYAETQNLVLAMGSSCMSKQSQQDSRTHCALLHLPHAPLRLGIATAKSGSFFKHIFPVICLNQAACHLT